MLDGPEGEVVPGFARHGPRLGAKARERGAVAVRQVDRVAVHVEAAAWHRKWRASVYKHVGREQLVAVGAAVGRASVSPR